MGQIPSLREPGKRERKRKERKAGRGLFLKGLRVTFQRIKVSNISIEPVLKPVDKRLYREQENKDSSCSHPALDGARCDLPRCYRFHLSV